MATAASRVSAFTRCCLTPRSSASRRSAFQASARGVDCSSRYAASASAITSSTTRSGSAMRTFTSPSRCALSVAANSLPSKSHTGFSCRRLTPASGWNGSIASVPAGVGCVQTHALRRTMPRSHARTPGSAEISAAATCAKALSTCSDDSYPVSGPTYTEAASSGDMSGTAPSASLPRYVTSRSASDSGYAPYRGSRSRRPFLTWCAYCVRLSGRSVRSAALASPRAAAAAASRSESATSCSSKRSASLESTSSRASSVSASAAAFASAAVTGKSGWSARSRSSSAETASIFASTFLRRRVKRACLSSHSITSCSTSRRCTRRSSTAPLASRGGGRESSLRPRSSGATRSLRCCAT